MSLIYSLLVLLHVLGMAALVGGYLVTLRRPHWNAAILWGARAQVVTGLLLVFMLELVDGLGEPNHMKIGIKLLISIAVAGLAEVGSRRTPVRTGLLTSTGVLAVVNTAIAVLW